MRGTATFSPFYGLPLRSDSLVCIEYHVSPRIILMLNLSWMEKGLEGRIVGICFNLGLFARPARAFVGPPGQSNVSILASSPMLSAAKHGLLRARGAQVTRKGGLDRSRTQTRHCSTLQRNVRRLVGPRPCPHPVLACAWCVSRSLLT